MSKHLRTGFVASLLLLALLAIPVLSFAQSTRGELAGNVTDPTGAVIAGAKVVAVAVDTGITNQTVTTSSGSFHFTELALGRYNVTVSAPGFSVSTSKGVLITINSTAVLNVALKAGAVTETVTIDASAPTIESQSSDVGGTISTQQIEDLPLSLATGVGGLRSPEAFSFLVPGTTGPGTAGGGLNANGVFFAKLGGGQSYGAEIMLDGSSITRSENGSSFDETSPSIEAMQEFKVTTAVPSAEFGHTTAGFESFSIKSGTNQYHGNVYTLVKNAAFDANDWFNNGYKSYYACTGNHLTTTPNCEGFLRGADSKFDYGGTIGGPVRLPNPFKRNQDIYNGKDKSFFFFSWEQYKLHQGVAVTSTVPTAAETQGDFSGILGAATGVINPCTGSPILQNQIFDPSTTTTVGGVPCRSPFPGNKIANISAAAKALEAGVPAPNQTGTTGAFGPYSNYATSFTNPTEDTTITFRIDENISASHRIFFSYSSRDNFHWLGNVNLPIPYNNSGYPQDFETHYPRIGWDWTISPTVLNHMNIGYNRTNSKNFAPQIGSKTTLASAGAPNFYSDAFPIVQFNTDHNGASDGLNGPDPFSTWGVGNNGDNIDNGLRFNDSLAIQKGRHSVKFGIDWRHQQYSVVQKNIPTISFGRGETDAVQFNTDSNSYGGNGYASFLLGQVDNSGQTVYNHNPRWQSHYIAGFIQDDVKMNANLTINVGFRYDLDPPRHEAENDTSNLSLTLPDPAAGNLPGALEFGTTCNCNSAWAETWKKNFAPRFGFAYLVPGTKGKTVVRGGAGIIYGPLQYNDFGSSMSLGFTQGRSVTSSGVNSNSGTTYQGFTPAFALDSGYAPWTLSYFAPNTSSSQVTGGFQNIGGELITPKMGRPPMTTQWSLQVQQEVAQDLIATVGYIGQVGQNLPTQFLTNPNNIDPKYFALGDQAFDFIPQGGTVTVNGQTYGTPYANFAGNLGQALLPYPQYGFIQDDCCLENLGHSSYNALEASLNRHFRQGFNLQVSYTFAKNLNNADSSIGVYTGNKSQGQNSSDLKQEKSVSLQNIPQTLSISYLYKFPFGKGAQFLNDNRALDLLVGGWEIGAIQRYSSGQPFDFGCATGAAYYLNCFRFTAGPAAPSGLASDAFKAKKNGPSPFNGESWFKPAYRPAGTVNANDPGVPLTQAAFVDMNREGSGWFRSPNESYVFGTGIPRVTEQITGPLFLSEDFSMIKDFAITERVKFQFKADAINAFNRHRMGLPNSEPAATNYGETGLQSGFGIPTFNDIGYPRQFQLSGHVTF